MWFKYKVHINLCDFKTTLFTPFMQDHLTKLSNKKIIVPESVRTVNFYLKVMGEKQWETFIYDQLVVSKVPVSQKITLNKIEIWNHDDAGQLKCKV